MKRLRHLHFRLKLYLVLNIILLVALAIIFGVAYLILETQFARNYIRKETAGYLAQKFDKQVWVGKIKGNALLGLKFDGFRITDRDSLLNSQVILDMKEMDVTYDLWNLLIKKINIKSLKMVEPVITLRREANGKLNWENIGRSFTDDDTTGTEEDKTEEESQNDGRKTSVNIDYIEIVDGDIRFIEFTPFKHFTDVDLKGSIQIFSGGSKDFYVEDFSAKVSQFPFEINKLSGYMEILDDDLRFRKLYCETNLSEIEAKGYLNKHTKDYDFYFDNSIISSQELFGFLVPQIENKIIGLFEVKGHARGNYEGDFTTNTVFNGEVWLSDMKIYGHYIENLVVPTKYDRGKLFLDNIIGRAVKTDLAGKLSFDFTQENTSYFMDMDMIGFNLREFNPRLPANLQSQITGNILVDGEGFSLDDIRGKVSINMSGSKIADLVIDDLSAEIDSIYNGQAKLKKLSIISENTSLFASGDFGKHFLDLEVETSEIDLQNFTSVIGYKEISGKFTLNALIQGQPTNPAVISRFYGSDGGYQNITFSRVDANGNLLNIIKNRQGDVNFRLDDLSINGYSFDSVKFNAEFNGDTLNVYPLTIQQNDSINLESSLQFITSSDQNFIFDFENMNLLYNGERFKGKLLGVIRGGGFYIPVIDLHFNGGTIQGYGEYAPGDSLQQFDINIALNHIDLSKVAQIIDFPYVMGGYYSSDFRLNGTLDKPEIAITNILADSLFLMLPPFDSPLSQPRIMDNARFTSNLFYDYPYIRVDSLIANYEDGKALLNGTFPIDLAFKSVEERLLSRFPTNFNLVTYDFPVSLANNLVKSDFNTDGKTDIMLTVTGPLDSLQMDLENIHVEEFVFGKETSVLGGSIHKINPLKKVDDISIDGKIHYLEKSLRIDSLTVVHKGKDMGIRGILPINLDIITDDKRLGWENNLELEITSQSIEPSILNVFNDEVFVKDGSIEVDLRITGSVKDPIYQGSVNLQHGKVTLNPIQVDLGDVNGRLIFTPGNVDLKGVTAQVNGGRLTAGGNAKMEGWLPQDLDIVAQGNNISLIMPQYFLVKGKCRAEAKLQGTIWRPYLSVEVVTTDQTIFAIPFGKQEEVIKTEDERTEFRFVIDVHTLADRNFWVRNDQANIEVSADLKMRLESTEPILWGQLDILRGTYTFIDKQFDVISGQFVFQNTSEIAPEIELIAENIIEGESRENDIQIMLSLTGTLENPEVSVYSPTHPELSEQDILLLLSLNLTWEQFTNLDRDGLLKKEFQATAQGYLEAVIANEARKLTPLDVVDLDTRLFGEEDEERSIRVTVGKYVSRDLFVSYSRDLLSAVGQRIKIDYFVNNKISVEGETDEQGAYNVDVKFKYKY